MRMDTVYWTSENQLRCGDILYIHVANIRLAIYVEQVEDDIIWTNDFLRELRSFEGQNGVFNITYEKNTRNFAFSVELQDQITIKHRNYVRLRVLAKPQELQRRESYRLSHSFDVLLRSFMLSNDADFTHCQAYLENGIQCKGLDISEKGVGVSSCFDWEMGDEVECAFEIRDEPFAFEATIVRKLLRVNEERTSDPYIYRLGIRFENEDDKMLKKIRQFIYKQQIAKMK